MLTIHLDLVNHKLLRKLRIYENIWIKDSVVILFVFWFLQYRTCPVGIPDTSGTQRTETLNFCPWPYRTCPVVISDTSGRCRTDIINSLLVIPCLAIVFILCPASQQINCSTRELFKSTMWQT